MVYYGMDSGKDVETTRCICKKEVKILGDGSVGYCYSCVCGHVEEFGKLPREKTKKLSRGLIL